MEIIGNTITFSGKKFDYSDTFETLKSLFEDCLLEVDDKTKSLIIEESDFKAIISFKDKLDKITLIFKEDNTETIEYLKKASDFNNDKVYGIGEYYFVMDKQQIIIYAPTIENFFSIVSITGNYASDKLIKETRNKKEVAKTMLNNCKKMNENLAPCLFAWLKNEEKDFQYRDIKLLDVKKKFGISYYESLFYLTTFMSEDRFYNLYINKRFGRK